MFYPSFKHFGPIRTMVGDTLSQIFKTPPRNLRGLPRPIGGRLLHGTTTRPGRCIKEVPWTMSPRKNCQRGVRRNTAEVFGTFLGCLGEISERALGVFG